MSSGPPSLLRRLLVALIAAILVIWLVVSLLVYRAAQHEVEEVFDADLARSARTLQTLLLHEVEEEQEMSAKVKAVVDEIGTDGLQRYPHLAAILRGYAVEEVRERLELVGTAQQAGHRYSAGLIIIARYADGSVMLRDETAPDFPLTAPGFVDVSSGDRLWRVYRSTDAETGFTVQVGERHAFRAELVGDITRATLAPLVIALPVMALLIWVIVGRVLAPLQRIARSVSQRAPDALDALDARDAPREVATLVAALNALFERMHTTLERERRFTADAAHELRTPLAALKTHLQVARNRTDDVAVRDSVDQALNGVDRATHLVAQLLTLARADAERGTHSARRRLDLRELAMQAVSRFSQQAIDRDIDLGIDASSAVMVEAEPVAIDILMRNLIDNALRYTPPGGTVTVAVDDVGDGARVRVLDDGPGVTADERERIFDRFHRGPDVQAGGASGSGLGLSIVRRIADVHGVRIELGEGLDGRGLGVDVVFPAG